MRRWRFVLGDALIAVATAITSMAERVYPDEPAPFFAVDSTLDDLSDGEWAGLIVLHAEAVHGCDHTATARAGIGMAGPRAKGVAS